MPPQTGDETFSDDGNGAFRFGSPVAAAGINAQDGEGGVVPY